MSCDPVREQLFTLDADQLEGLAHLSDCDACRSLAGQILAAEHALDAHVVHHADSGDFDAAWTAAAPPAPLESEASTGAARFTWIHGAGIALAAAAALALVLWPLIPLHEGEDGWKADYVLSVGGVADVTFERTVDVVTVGDPALVQATFEGSSLRMEAVSEGATSVSVLFEEPGPPEVFTVLVPGAE